MNTMIFDELLERLNTLPKHLIDNQFIAFGSELSTIAHALMDAKTAVLKQNEKIIQLEKQVRDFSKDTDGIVPIEKGK